MKDYDYLEKLSEWEPFIIGAHVILLEIIFLLFPIVANYLIPWYVKILITIASDICLFNKILKQYLIIIVEITFNGFDTPMNHDVG